MISIENKDVAKANYLGYSAYAKGPYYETNNKYNHFPPIMNDGRSVVSTWNNSTQWDNFLLISNNINSNSKYREYLTKNAQKIMRDQYFASSNDSGFFLDNAYKSEKIDTNIMKNEKISSPYMYHSYMTIDKPITDFYQNSDLKNTFLENQKINARKFRPTFSSSSSGV